MISTCGERKKQEVTTGEYSGSVISTKTTGNLTESHESGMALQNSP